jgi:hypothetical protein
MIISKGDKFKQLHGESIGNIITVIIDCDTDVEPFKKLTVISDKTHFQFTIRVMTLREHYELCKT